VRCQQLLQVTPCCHQLLSCRVSFGRFSVVPYLPLQVHTPECLHVDSPQDPPRDADAPCVARRAQTACRSTVTLRVSSAQVVHM